MVKRNEAIVKVRDPSGKLFEVTRRNATDLVQHKGWTYATPQHDNPQDALAAQPRTRKARGAKLDEIRAQTAAAAETEGEAAKPKRGRPKKEVAAAPVTAPVYDLDDDEEEVVPFDAAVAKVERERDDLDELDELEAEEDERGNV